MRAARYHLAPLLTGGGCVWPPRPTAEPVAAYRPGGGEGLTPQQRAARSTEHWPHPPPSGLPARRVRRPRLLLLLLLAVARVRMASRLRNS
jgi:hypothetical protein